ncbi:Hsp70 family protein, partial [Sinorhizobium meliloti]
ANSVDADTHRSVTEEARKIRQEVALLKINPENVERVLNREVESAETDFDDIRSMADNDEIERHERLLVTARRNIREGDFEAARFALDEMQSVRFKIVAKQPEFLVSMFGEIASEDYLAVDQAVHQKLVEQGYGFIDENDMEGLRSVIRGLLNNRVTLEVSGTKIIELAHLLGG